MTLRHKSRLTLSLLIVSSMVSIATGVLCTLLYTSHHIPQRAGLLAVMVGEFTTLVAVPVWLFSKEELIGGVFTICSNLLALIAGLFIMHDSFNGELIGKVFWRLFVVGVFLGGVSIGSMLQSYNLESGDQDDTEEMVEVPEEKMFHSRSSSDRMVSMKPSAATLVGFPDSLPSLHNCRVRSNTHQAVDYSIKKLSIINQSQSSTSISQIDNNNNNNNNNNAPRVGSDHTIKSAVYTPTLSRTTNVEKTTLMRERAAIKRIPSVLLPPHLRPQQNGDLSQKKRMMMLPTQSMNDIAMQYEESVMQQIPRSVTLSSLPFRDHGDGMKTMTLQDYEQNYDDIQGHSAVLSSLPVVTPDLAYHDDYDDDDDDNGDDDGDDNGDDEMDGSSEDALKYIQDANEHDFKSAMEQTVTDLNLSRVRTPPSTVALSKSSSPHKSIFGHSRMSSSLSFTGPGSSPKRRASRKLGALKNLSLSSIVYKEPDTADDTPDFSYVHELQQSSPSRKRQQPETPVREQPVSKASSTPESCGSRRSVFPTEVIGEYDKEKWKTMVRLQMVE